MTFRQFALDCQAQLETWGYSKETRDSYMRRWMQFLAYVKMRGARDDLRSFTDRLTFDFAAWLGQADETRKAAHPNTIINMLSALSTLAQYGMMRKDDHDRRLLSEDPTRSFRWPRAQHQETKWAHPPEVRALVDVVLPVHQAVARDILIETGIRRGQSIRLRVKDFREEHGRFYLSVTKKGRGQQRHEQRDDLPISRGLGLAIRAWLQQRDVDRLHTEPDSPLLISGQGKEWSPTGLTNMIARLGQLAGVKRFRLSPHKLRHSKNVRDRMAGLDAVQRQRLNTHSSLRSQERYDHLGPGEIDEAADQSLAELNRWVGKPDRHLPDEPGECQTEPAPDRLNDEGLW